MSFHFYPTIKKIYILNLRQRSTTTLWKQGESEGDRAGRRVVEGGEPREKWFGHISYSVNKLDIQVQQSLGDLNSVVRVWLQIFLHYFTKTSHWCFLKSSLLGNVFSGITLSQFFCLCSHRVSNRFASSPDVHVACRFSWSQLLCQSFFWSKFIPRIQGKNVM